MSEKKTTKSGVAAKRIRMLQDKKLKYFMENRAGEFRLKVIPDKRNKEKINTKNYERFQDEED